MPIRRLRPPRPETVSLLAALSLTGCSLLTFQELRFDGINDSAAPLPDAPDGGPEPPPAEPDGSPTQPPTDTASAEPTWPIGRRNAYPVLPSPCLGVERPLYVYLTPGPESHTTCPWSVDPVSLTVIDPVSWSFEPESCSMSLTIRLGSSSNGNTYSVTGSYVSPARAEGTLDFFHNETGLACRVTAPVVVEHETR